MSRNLISVVLMLIDVISLLDGFTTYNFYYIPKQLMNPWSQVQTLQ